MHACLARLLMGVVTLSMVAGCASTAVAPTAPPAKPTDAPKPAPAAPAPAPAAPVAAASPVAAPAAPAPKPAASPAAPAAPADSPLATFYRGKTVRIMVGSAPGGGYDTYARAVARHLGRHIPGEPNVIVENVAGAGSLLAANQVYKTEAKDGTVIGHIQGGLFLQQLLGLEGVEFDAVKWQVLGAPTGDTNTCVVTKQSGISSLAEVMNPGGKQLIVGGNAPGSATWDVATRLRSALDLNLKLVAGYDGTAKVRLAMDQGEVDGICGWGYESVMATARDRIESGEYLVIAQVTEAPLPGLEKAPVALQLAKTEEARQLIRLGIMVPSQVLRPFLVAPEVPAERVQALRQAFDATMKDKEFLADAEKAKLELAPISGQEVEKLIRDLAAMPDPLKVKLKQIVEQAS
jgi:tripartite-type tricarboxylate transporter receptor subunit TctC